MKVRLVFILVLGCLCSNAQTYPGYWQQTVEYKMEIDFDVKNHQFKGKQTLVYTNNSPDTLDKVFYHLYFNAFQPGSMMDIRSRTISDPDRRVRDRIYNLKEDEIGYHKIKSLKQDGKNMVFEVVGTILEVKLNKPILPGETSTFKMEFESQVPIQIRRSGRNNKEGVEYSMTQWYPKLSEYDKDGWHANPYIGREFHGVWGNFDVKIIIDSSYLLGGTGNLQNPQQIGHGYEDKSKSIKRAKGNRLTWHFIAEKVHDFAWAADPDFVHDIVKLNETTDLHFIYQGDTLVENWKNLQPLTVKAFNYINNRFGKYPYKQFSVIQGGDGGMEYPMATLISGWGSMRGLLSVTVHEALHNWYYGLLATNESKFPWMDEGFTVYAQYATLNHVYGANPLNPYARQYGSYLGINRAGLEEPLTTHADHYEHNAAYGTASYSKGSVFLHQLSYIIGQEAFDKGMKRYFETWKYKHPTADDFKRVMEKTSGIELDWYFENFVYTTKTIDYGIKSVISNENQTKVELEKIGKIPMPLDIQVVLKDGRKINYYIPLRIMRGEKPIQDFDGEVKTKTDWPWTYPSYILNINFPMSQIESIVIDPSTRLADIDRSNNYFPKESEFWFEGK